MLTNRWLPRLAAALLLVGGLAACNGGGTPGAAGPTGGIVASPGPVDLFGLAQVCTGTVALPDAPAYAGTAPHPLIAMTQGVGNGPRTDGYPFTPDLEFQVVGPDGPVLTDFTQAQLVACEQRTAQQATSLTCGFLGEAAVPFFRAAYTETIRAVQTGQVVATIPLNPGSGGCPSSATVLVGGEQVFGAAGYGQRVNAVYDYMFWDGQGTPPAQPTTTSLSVGPEQVQGSLHLTTVTGIDPTSPVLRDYAAFWAAYTAVRESVYPDFSAMLPVTDHDLDTSLREESNQDSQQDQVEQGPVYLTVTGVTADGASVLVDACDDETGRSITADNLPVGTIGTQSRVRVVMTAQGSGYVASAIEAADLAACPPAFAAVPA